MKYFEEAKYIWKNLVPKEGQANNVQGELLRQLEKLRYEAQNNGNINWDSNFELAYCEDDLYDIVVDAIAVFYLKYKEPIPYSKNTKVYR